MRPASYLLVPLIVAVSTRLPAQSNGVLLPVGARVKADTRSASTTEGTLVALRGDTLIVRGQAGDTVRLPGPAVTKLRVVESPALWRYTSPSDINFYSVVTLPGRGDAPSGAERYFHQLVISNKTELSAVDPASGAPLWTRRDWPDVKGVAVDYVGLTGYGVLTRADTMHIFDLRTGETRWNTATVSLLGARGWLPFPGSDSVLLMLGRTAQSPATLVAIDIATGNVRWRQDSLFTSDPKVFNSGDVPYLFGNQPPFADTDTSLVLYISADGPLRLNARTGAPLWRGDALRATKLPTPDDGYAYIEHWRDMLFIPSGDSLLALRATDGKPAWTAPHRFKSRVIRMEATQAGLLVRGDRWVDLLDPATGRSVWAAPVQLKNATRIEVRGDTTYVVADKKVLAIRNGDGTVRTLATVNFKESEIPTSLTVWKAGLILSSWHNLMLVDRQGTTRYHRVYPSPKESFGEALRSGAGADIMRPTTRWTAGHIFFFTGAPDSAGREGFSIVKVDPEQGREQARVWFDKRVPSYTLDGFASRAYYRRDDRTLDAVPFPDGTALRYAARYGQTAVARQLLAMGVNAGAATSEGWTALHFAARAGHGDVVRLLLASGATVDAKTRDHWTPWMLAAREGHDEVAATLRDAGAKFTDAEATLLNGWHLATRGRIADALGALTQATALDSTLALWPAVWQSVCWDATMAGQAADVLPLCDRAVERTTIDDVRFASVHLSRAIARALTGNLEGAAADLEVCAACAAGDEAERPYRVWIDALREGRNPFTPAVLASLRR